MVRADKSDMELVLARFNGIKNPGNLESETHGDVILVAQPALMSRLGHQRNWGANSAMILSDGSVAAGKIRVEVANHMVPVSLRIAMAQEELENAGGNVFALAGNDGNIKNATGAVLRSGHVWLTSNEETSAPLQMASAADGATSEDFQQN